MSIQDAEKLVHAFVTSRLDYCNDLLPGCLSKCIKSRMQQQESLPDLKNIITSPKLLKMSVKTPASCSAHALSTRSFVDFTIIKWTFKALHGLGLATQYLSELLTPYIPKHNLHSSQSGLSDFPLLIFRKNYIYIYYYTSRLFSVLAPRWWNELPLHVRTAESLIIFKRRLKTYLF
ncbi:hypothetical protein C0J45_21400, partial [Silurus meridionalis]